MKIGLFFGSFNPIHIGHLIIANTMAENTDLDQVWLVVSPQNPAKRHSNSLLHEFDRYDMVEKAIADNHKLKVTDIEFHLPRPSYTIDTLTYIQEKYSTHQFVIIMGGDNLVNLPKWKNADKILEYYEIYVYPRPHTEKSDLENHPKIKIVEAPLVDISATFIRNQLQQNKSIKYLTPENVEEHIKRKKFYI